MASIDLKKICTDHYRRTYDGSNSALEINLDQVKLQVDEGSDVWKDTSPVSVSEGPTRQMRVNNNTQGADVFGNVQTSKDSVLTTKVALTAGLVKGLNKKMRLPLPPQVSTSLGESVKIDPGNPTSESEDKMTVSITSGHDIGPGQAAAVATVKCKTGEYQGQFTCRVSLTGPVIYRESSGTLLQTDIKNVFSAMSVPLSWSMEGHCHFQWDFEQTIDWN